MSGMMFWLGETAQAMTRRSRASGSLEVLTVRNRERDAGRSDRQSLHPTLATFFASLSDEQKAQFNNMGYSGPTGGKG